jgi:hypothetical protein
MNRTLEAIEDMIFSADADFKRLVIVVPQVSHFAISIDPPPGVRFVGSVWTFSVAEGSNQGAARIFFDDGQGLCKRGRTWKNVGFAGDLRISSSPWPMQQNEFRHSLKKEDLYEFNRT